MNWEGGKPPSLVEKVMYVRHTVSDIAYNPQDYKYCNDCGLVNWHENKRCHECGGTVFNPMNGEDAAELLRDWNGEEDFRLTVE